MRKVILNVAMSLDGLIEGPKGEYDWCFTDQDYGMKNFLNRIDAIFYGRKSYEMMVGADGGNNPFKDKQSFLFSNSLPTSPVYKLVNGEIESKVQNIKQKKGKDIWLFGGAKLTTSLLTFNLVDEVLLAVHPIVLGKGKPLFTDLLARCALELIDSKSYSSGLVQLHYQILPSQRSKNKD